MKNLEKCVLILKALSDDTRLRIVNSIIDEPKRVSEIANELQMMQSAISHQLLILKLNGIVKNNRKGREVYYSLDDEHIKSLIETIDEHASHKNDE